MSTKRDVKDTTQFREFLLSNGLTPADVAIVARNKRIKNLINEKYEAFKENKILQAKLINKEAELGELKELLEAGKIRKARASGSNRGKTAKVPNPRAKEVFAEIYANGDFRRYLVGDYTLKHHLRINIAEARQMVQSKERLEGGNYLVNGIDVKRTCTDCKTTGEVGVDFQIHKKFIDSKCIPCKKEYMRIYRVNNRQRIKDLIVKWKAKKEY